MKKLILLIIVTVFFAFLVNAQTESVLKSEIKTNKTDKKIYKDKKRQDRKELRALEGTKVSEQALQQFTRDFGNLPVLKAYRSYNFDEITFVQNGIQSKAYYDGDAQLVGTTHTIAYTNLPANAQKKINKLYKAYKVMEVILFDDNEANESDIWFYNTRFNDADSYFVRLQNANKRIIVQVDLNGDISYFASLK
mgnify:FL=1